MNEKNIKELFTLISNGDFNAGTQLIVKNQLNTDSKTVVKVLKCCYSVLKKNSLVKYDLLINLLKSSCEYAANFEEKSLEEVYTCFIYIMQYFIDQNKIGIIYNFIPVISKSYNAHNQSKIIPSFKTLCNLLHNTISNMCKTNSKKYDGIFFYKFCISVIELYSNILPAYELLTTKVILYFQPFNFNIDTESIHNIYLDLLKIICSKYKNQTEHIDAGLLHVLTTIVVSYKDNFTLISQCLFKTILLLCTLKLSKNLGTSINYLKSIIEDLNMALSPYHQMKTLQKFFNSLKILSTETKNFSPFCLLLAKIINKLSYFYQDNVELSKNLDIGVLRIWSSVLELIHDNILNSKYRCKVCTNCAVKRNLYLFVNLYDIVTRILVNFISKQKRVDNDNLEMVINNLQGNFDYIYEMKQLNCSQWNMLWKHYKITMYNLAGKLYTCGYSECTDYLLRLVKQIIVIEGVSTTPENILHSSLICLTEFSIKNNLHKEALFYSAFNIVLHENDRNKAFSQWVRVLASLKETMEEKEYAKLSIPFILDENVTLMKDLYPDLSITTEIKIELLIYGLKEQKSIWPSKISMMSAMKQLKTLADVSLAARTFVEIWADKSIQMHPDGGSILVEIMDEFERSCNKDSSDKIMNDMYLACLYFMRYTHELAELRCINIKDMKANANVIKDDDDSDFVMNYASLHLKSFLTVTQYLNKSLELFQHFLNHESSVNLKYISKFENILEILSEIANECHSQGFAMNEIMVRLFIMKVAELQQNDIAVLRSVAHIVELVDAKSKLSEIIYAKSKSTISKIEKLRGDSNHTALAMFYMKTSLADLKSNKIQEGLNNYQLAKKFMDKIPNNEKNELFKLQLELIHSKYLALPCSLQIEGHDYDFLGKPHQILSAMSILQKKSGAGADRFETTTLIETGCNVGHNYRWLRLPREVRCYCKDFAVLCQKLVLPVRAGYFLVELAHADLLSNRFDDCQAKLDALDDILYLKDDEEVEALTEDLKQMSLLVSKRRNNVGSPIFLNKSLMKMPSNLKHSPNCKCFFCTSLEYQNLLLLKIDVQALLYSYQENYALAEKCFQKGLDLFHRFVSRKQTLAKKSLLNKKDSYVPDIEDYFWETHCSILLHLCNNCIYDGDIHRAMEINSQLIQLVSKNVFRNVHLYNEVLYQKSNLVFKNTNNMENDGNSFDIIEDSFAEGETPPSKCSSVNGKQYPSFFVQRMPKLVVKKIDFDLDGTEDKKTDEDKNISTKFEIFATPYPKVPKIKVESPKTTKHSRKKTTILQEVSNTTHRNNKCTLTTTPVALSTPRNRSPELEKTLQSATAKLTEKLKQSTTKKQKPQADNKECPVIDAPKTGMQRETRARKNLMQDLINVKDTTNGNCEKRPKRTVRKL